MNSEIPTTSSNSPATLTGVTPLEKQRPRRQRSGAAGSLAAQGEPLVWLTGGALVIAMAMVIGLLGFIFVQGISTFWPGPLVEIKSLDGKTFLGEQTDTELFKPSPDSLKNLSPELQAKLKDALEPIDGFCRRRLLRTGNFEITSTDANWINDFMVQSESQPEWAVLFERLEWGRMYGIPAALVVDGKPVASTPAEAWAKLQELLPSIQERHTQREKIEQFEIGAISRRQKSAQLAIMQAELSYGKKSSEWQAASEYSAQVDEGAIREKELLNADIQKLNKENARYVLQVTTAQDQVANLPVEQIVRAIPANQLGFWGKVGVYLSRWREFLFDDPREANSEGGVFPAIWGTIAMTIILSALVVPFGVLAALYLREYAKGGPIVTAIRIAINNLAGVPSIVFGVFGLGFFCYNVGGWIDRGADTASQWSTSSWWTGMAGLATLLAVGVYSAYRAVSGHTGTAQDRERARVFGRLGLVVWLAAAALAVLLITYAPYFHGFFRAKWEADKAPTFGTGGLLWASLTLALLTLPVVIVATEEALSSVPKSMREGSYACGASKWQTIWRIVLPRALPGIMTGMILAMARGAGEVAPLMLVGVQKLTKDLPVDSIFPFLHPERSFMHLGFHIFDVGMQSRNSEAGRPMVFTTTLLLIAVVATLNIAAVYIRTRLRRKFAASHF